MKLKKELNLLDAFCIASGAMISSGLFILPGLAHSYAGPAVVFSYFFAGMLALTGMLSQAELVSAMPKTGGTYFFVTRSMGSAAGTIQGLVIWFSLCLKSAFAIVGMSSFVRLIILMDMKTVSVVLCLIFVFINIAGIKEAGKLQRLLVIALFLILGIFIVKGIGAVKIHNFYHFAPNGISSVLTTAGFVFISFGGLLKVASVAEEIKDPEKTIPMAMMLSLITVTFLYTITVFIASGVLGAEELDSSLAPITDTARVFMGNKGAVLMSLAAVLAFISTANAGIMAASRYPVALAYDSLIPSVFAATTKKSKTPYISILFTGAAVITALFFKLDSLVKIASAVLITTFLFSCLSVIIMRESRLQNYGPKFKSPLYPWIQIIGISGYALLIFEMGIDSLLSLLVLMAAGFVFYFLYGRIRYSRESALLHLIERITSKELTSRSLESELKEIIRERDHIVKDRFDSMIENCIILDIDEVLDVGCLFDKIAGCLSPRLDIPSETICRKLFDREKDTSTAIGYGAAIPHIIIEGNNKFEVLMLRAKNGISFNPDTEPVYAVFALLGTKDERNFHLRAIASIAQILQGPEFLVKWKNARDIEALRDIVLLSKRLRSI